MSDETSRNEVIELIETSKGVLIDDFAHLMSLLNDEKFDDAALFCYALAQGLGLFATGLQALALADKFDPPQA